MVKSGGVVCFVRRPVFSGINAPRIVTPGCQSEWRPYATGKNGVGVRLGWSFLNALEWPNMAVSTDPRERVSWLYHFTDTRNLAKIKELGGLYSFATLKEMGMVDGLCPGGNDWSQTADAMFGMDRYVHLCLRANHPMEHIAREEGRIEKAVWLLVEGSIMKLDGVLFTMDVSNKSGVRPISLEEAAEQIDYQVLTPGLNWNDPGINARLRSMEKCEVLVPDHVPFRYFEKYFPNG